MKTLLLFKCLIEYLLKIDEIPNNELFYSWLIFNNIGLNLDKIISESDEFVKQEEKKGFSSDDMEFFICNPSPAYPVSEIYVKIRNKLSNKITTSGKLRFNINITDLSKTQVLEYKKFTECTDFKAYILTEYIFSGLI